MSDNTPTPPPGAIPPKPAEAAKVQPKKETVRITLPPKPTASPTVRLPSVAPATAPTVPFTAAQPAPAPAAPAAPAPAAAAAPAPATAPATAPAMQRTAPTSTAPKPASAPRPTPATSTAAAGIGFSKLDFGLAVAAGVIALAAAVVYLLMFINFPTS
jgi:hypothetical protein